MVLVVNKSVCEEIKDCLLKSHYLRRLGYPGNYKYIYEEPDGMRHGSSDSKKETSKDNFAAFIDDFIKGGYKSDKIATVLEKTPVILRMCGISDNPITISPNVLKKILLDEEQVYHGHKIGKEVLKDLPNQLKDPVYVLKGNEGKKIIVTEYFVDDKPVIAVLELDRKQGHINVNSIRTLYDKKKEVFGQWISNKDTILHENKEKSRVLLQSIGLQSTKETSTPDNSTIPPSTDSVKRNIKKSIYEQTKELLKAIGA